MLRRVGVFCGSEFLQEVAAHELLGYRRATLRKYQ